MIGARFVGVAVTARRPWASLAAKVSGRAGAAGVAPAIGDGSPKGQARQRGPKGSRPKTMAHARYRRGVRLAAKVGGLYARPHFGLRLARMASVVHPTPTCWVVHLASQSKTDREVTVELRMSKATVDNLAHVECSPIAGLNPGRTDLPAQDDWPIQRMHRCGAQSKVVRVRGGVVIRSTLACRSA